MKRLWSLPLLALAGLLTVADAAIVRSHEYSPVCAFQPTQAPGYTVIAMDKAHSTPKNIQSHKETEGFQVDNVVVGDIQFAIEKNATEKVFFALNRFCNPEIFPLEGNNPRIVIDIKKVSSWNGRARIPVNGLLIKQVRISFHRDQNKLRIVLDLNPSMDYVAAPIYYKAEGVYCIEVRAK